MASGTTPSSSPTTRLPMYPSGGARRTCRGHAVASTHPRRRRSECCSCAVGGLVCLASGAGFPDGSLHRSNATQLLGAMLNPLADEAEWSFPVVVTEEFQQLWPKPAL
eukprot:7291686-Pyramimonas_sp.AAC.1